MDGSYAKMGDGSLKAGLLPTAQPAIPIAQPATMIAGTAGTPGMGVPVVATHVARPIGLDDVLPNVEGVMIRERQFLSQILCAVCEKQTQFTVAPWDSTVPDEATDAHFRARGHILEVRERSECCQRYCLHQARHLELGVFPLGGAAEIRGGTGWPTDQAPTLVFEKPTSCCMPFGCCILGCNPEMNVLQPDAATGERRLVGKVSFDYQWWNCCWPCVTYMDVSSPGVTGEMKRDFVLRRPDCFQDGCINCFAPTCCNRNHRAFIHDGTAPGHGGAVVGELNNIWPGCNFRGVCQADSGADNFVIKFPAPRPGQSREEVSRDRTNLMAGLFLHNFVFWEKRGNQK